jgi:SPP1 family predicted phage head-tail adaptor
MANMDFVAGELNRRVVIKLWADTPDLGFAVTESFTTAFTVWAAVQPVGLAVYQSSMQIDNAITHRFIVRRQASVLEAKTITNKHVVEYNSYRYRVKRVAELGDAREFIVIEAEQLEPTS